jgi:excinuclease ABC subunit C
MTKLWEKILTLDKFQKKNILPETPGVYFFLGSKREILYIGKAASLRDRVKSYFARDIMLARGPKIRLMLELTHFVAYRTTDSVLEAFILETNLIKRYQPPYNTDAKDDKSFNYVVITRERFPRVLIMRGKELFVCYREEAKGRRGDPEKRMMTKKIIDIKYQFGPFPHGIQLREAMKIVRKLFPYRDKCMPYAELVLKRQEKARPCFAAQIGLCPGVCTGAISARAYQRTIYHISLFFAGRQSQLIKKLEREMRESAKSLEFERAGAIKKTLFALRHIQDIALVKDESRRRQDYGGQIRIENKESGKIKIEAYDIAHLGGNSSVGVMVAVQDGEPVKEAYKKFILRGKHGGNDLTALQEILERRLQHLEWPLPDIIVVDGGELQCGVAERALLVAKLTIPIVGVVKNVKHQPERFIGPPALIKRFQKDILLANSEAHRFAIAFHRRRRQKDFL